MVSIFNVAVVLLVSMIGVGWTSYKLGLKKGAEALVDILIEEGIVKVIEDEDEET
jgi:hypothetical protein